MTTSTVLPLLIGEVFVDFTVTPRGSENKLRLGGIAHAARGFWATGQPFRAAAVLPAYLEKQTRDYFATLGCVELIVLGIVTGAPNVTVLFDATEVADQGYETLLRDEKIVLLNEVSSAFAQTEEVLFFPGSFSMAEVCAMLPKKARLHIDAAYDVKTPDVLASLGRDIETLLISTSSPLFAEMPRQSLEGVAAAFANSRPKYIVLKQNRGGTELLDCSVSPPQLTALPAQLGTTINSVGVGDVFAAAFLSALPEGPASAGWRATYAAAAYSQTTYPDLFKTYVERDKQLSLEDMSDLWGAFLPWNARPSLQIYFAAPDFTNGNRTAIDEALEALTYHNFKPRRPVVEHGELPPNSSAAMLQNTYARDRDLLKQCALVFAVPTQRDPGTLVEVGLAIEAGIPVVTYDPRSECNNTMVMAGSSFYSASLDSCLNGVFQILSQSEAS
jgi:nucleoside 2-deoxyribosyltransferase